MLDPLLYRYGINTGAQAAGGHGDESKDDRV